MRLLSTLILAFLLLGELSLARAEKALLPGCETTFTCFVPESCTVDPNAFSSQTAVVSVTRMTPVDSNCDAVIRFHAYTPTWMYVSIESFGAATSIEFKHTFNGATSSFECKFDASTDEVKGAYASASGARFGDKIEYVKSPLKCTFLLKTQSEKVNTLSGDTKLFIGGIPSRATRLVTSWLNCDPTMFKFYPADNVKPEEKYSAVSFNPATPDHYEICKGNLFNRMQYRKYDADSYSFATNLHCVDSTYWITVDGQSSPEEIAAGHVNIRCVADAEYFCKYRVRTITSTDDPTMIAPLQDPSDPTIPKKGEIKCPPTHPYIVVNEKPVLNGVFKCQNRGASLWTINELMLRENSAEVHCSNSLKCHIIDKLPASSIRKGSMVDNIPTCRDHEGTMKLSENANVVTKIFCNTQTGKYMYTTGGQDVEVGKSTFYCEYPKKINKAANAKNKAEAIQKGLITTACIIVGTIILFSLGVFLLSYLRFYCLERKMMKMDDAAFNEYCTGEAAKKKKERERKEQAKKTKKTDKEKSDESSNGLMNAYILSMRQHASDSVFPSGVVEKNQYVSKCLSKMTAVTGDNIDTVRKANEEEPFAEISPWCPLPESGAAKSAIYDHCEVIRMSAADKMAPSESLEKSAKDLDEEKKNN